MNPIIQIHTIYFKIIILIFLFQGMVFGNYSQEKKFHEAATLEDGPLFISLGSTCEPAHMLRYAGLRHAAFPFDWIVSMDIEKLIEILDNNFWYFLQQEYLVPYNIGGGPLLHTRYHLEFLHEGDWRNEGYHANMPAFQEKYHRRIERFKKLSTHKGSIIFIRSAYVFSMTDPHRYYHVPQNLEISDEEAMKLYQALQRFFPKGHFSLFIVNPHTEKHIIEEKRLLENLHIIRANPYLEHEHKGMLYREFFQQKSAECFFNCDRY